MTAVLATLTDRRMHQSIYLSSSQTTVPATSFKSTKDLTDIFLKPHENITSVMMELANSRGLLILTQSHLMHDDYWTTGDYDYKSSKLVAVSPMVFVAVDHIEKVMVTGVQILYQSHRLKKYHGSDYDVTIMRRSDGGSKTIVEFKYNGQLVFLCLEHYPQDNDPLRMTLYSSD